MTNISTNIPLRIVLESDLPSGTLPILYFTPAGIDPLVMIVQLPHPVWNVRTLLEVYALPRAHLAVDVLQT